MKNTYKHPSYQKAVLAALIVVALALIVPADLTWGARLFQTLPTPGPSPTKSAPTATQGAPKPTNTRPPRPTKTPTSLPIIPTLTYTFSAGGQSSTATPGGLVPTSSTLEAGQPYPGPGSYPYPGQTESSEVPAYQGTEAYPLPVGDVEVAASPIPGQVEATSNLFIPVSESTGQDRSGVLLIIAGILMVLAGLVWFVLGRRPRTSGE